MPPAQEKECMQCRVLGTAVFGAAGLHSAMEALHLRRLQRSFIFRLLNATVGGTVRCRRSELV